jgi:hypothetical protein
MLAGGSGQAWGGRSSLRLAVEEYERLTALDASAAKKPKQESSGQ